MISQSRLKQLLNYDPVTGLFTRLVGRAGKAYKGISWSKVSKKWHAQISHEGRVNNLGYCNNKKDAAQAYKDAASKYHGDFIHVTQTTTTKTERGLNAKLQHKNTVI